LQTERIDDKTAAAYAARIESTAYAAAETAGTGALREYANKAAEMVLAELKNKSVPSTPHAPADLKTSVVRVVSFSFHCKPFEHSDSHLGTSQPGTCPGTMHMKV
jgi:hypothetical protein